MRSFQLFYETDCVRPFCIYFWMLGNMFTEYGKKIVRWNPKILFILIFHAHMGLSGFSIINLPSVTPIDVGRAAVFACTEVLSSAFHWELILNGIVHRIK